ncbi:histone deacetylase family protein [Herbaspirillum sp. SJZ107]|uniref:histone deacetylase family protein n=1 Tax=Herbaspirillum sp. SJZ107 TaxID=2572881 RepID=UPI001154A72B|nr:histone deacetylase family protein [Herbaspirillum sp. SJZ107]TQK05297.1 acetoin utilization deacetylase AcuC-like enzyme [Herbaspirillum sp. SJZ107]
MLTFFNEHHAHHGPRAVPRPGAPLPCSEIPERLDLIVAELHGRGLGQIVTPHGVSLASLERVHTPRYLHFLRSAWSAWLALDPRNAGRDIQPAVWPARMQRHDIEPDDFTGRLGLYAMDGITPLTAGTWIAAKTGADCAINAAHALRLGEHASFALTRPPGHHAGADHFGGGCFLNNAALAAQHLLDDGLERVAILDLDAHHGNGTQGIFYGRGDVLFVSIHADPHAAYPYYSGHADETGAGPGAGANMNLPLARGAGSTQWFAALETACLKMAGFAPQALVVSLGVQSHFGLGTGDFLRLGERLGYLGLPTAFMLEGGDAGPALGVDVVNVLDGFETVA